MTGGAGHVGRMTIETLRELGVRVVALDRVAVRGGLRCDLRDEAATRAAARAAMRRLGGLDILVHAAGYVGTSQVPGWAEPIESQSAVAMVDAFRVNVASAFVLAQECRSALARSGRGSIILFSSIYGRVGPDLSLYQGTSMANPVGYGVSKGGLLQLMRYLATLLAPRIRVNAISPGGIRRGQPRSFVTRYTARTPLKRMAVEGDLKGAVAYLAGDLSAYVTGHDLVVDGGWTAW